MSTPVRHRAQRAPMPFPRGWSHLQGGFAGGRMTLPPGARVPVGRPPEAGGMIPAQRPVQPQPGPPLRLDDAMGLAAGGAPQGAPAAPAAPGTGIPPSAPAPETGRQGAAMPGGGLLGVLLAAAGGGGAAAQRQRPGVGRPLL